MELTPPPEVWREVDIAAGAWERLRSQGRELHFEADDETGRVVMTLRDLEGNVLREVSVTYALAAACGPVAGALSAA